MLRSWRDEVRIALTPERVTLARLARRWKPRLVAKHSVSAALGDQSGWRASIDALEQGLRETQWGDADAVVILSNHYVRYALVPWSEHLTTEEEKRAWVAHHFADLYGEAPDGAEYRWSEERPNAPCMASAVETGLIASIRGVFEGSSLELRSIQPYLMAAFNRCRRELKGASSWLVFPESGRVCIASVGRDEWRAVTSKSIGRDRSSDLSLILEREMLLADDEAPAAVLAYAPGAANPGLDMPDEIPLKVLPLRALAGYSGAVDRDYAMALTGRI